MKLWQKSNTNKEIERLTEGTRFVMLKARFGRNEGGTTCTISKAKKQRKSKRLRFQI